MWDLVKVALADWRADNASRLAAAVAFYTAVSLAPLMVIVLAVVGFVFGPEAMQGHLARQLSDLVGPQAATFLQEIVQSASQRESGLVASVLSGITLVLGASGVFGELQAALNRIFDVEPPHQTLWRMVKTRALSLSLVLALGFLLTVSLVLSAALSALSHRAGLYGPVLHELASVAVFTLLFGLLFKVLPDCSLSWRDVWVGALATSVLFTLGKLGIGIYLGQSAIASTYGAAGALVILLLWLYYSAQILFLGAELTQVYARHRASGRVPRPRASHRSGLFQGSGLPSHPCA